MSYFTDRAREASTWNGLGLAALAGLQAYQQTHSKTTAAVTILALLFGGAGAAMPNAVPPPSNQPGAPK